MQHPAPLQDALQRPAEGGERALCLDGCADVERGAVDEDGEVAEGAVDGHVGDGRGRRHGGRERDGAGGAVGGGGGGEGARDFELDGGAAAVVEGEEGEARGEVFDGDDGAD